MAQRPYMECSGLEHKEDIYVGKEETYKVAFLSSLSLHTDKL